MRKRADATHVKTSSFQKVNSRAWELAKTKREEVGGGGGEGRNNMDRVWRVEELRYFSIDILRHLCN